MKRIAGGIVALFLALFALPVAVGAAVNDFSFQSFEADYYLDRDSDGRSTLKTVEKLVAEFPNFDQNHGIERAIPKSYDGLAEVKSEERSHGHSTSLRIVSVTDANKKALPYSTYSDNHDNLVVRVGSADQFVRGQQTYIITYEQRDVTKYFANPGDDEFYWDTNGAGWSQPFGRVVARVHLSDTIAKVLNGNTACYQGATGSTERCEITREGNAFTAQTTNLAAGQNMTIAIGFAPHTFAGYQPSVWDKLFVVWVTILIISSIVGFASLFWLAYRYSKSSNRTNELPPIPVEYIPPKGTSVLAAAQIGDDTRADTTAQLIDLAVRHYITITQTAEKSLWKQAEYDLEIVKNTAALTSEEQDFVQTLFGDTAVGTVLATKTLKNNYSVASKLQSNARQLTKKIKGEYELRHEDKAVSRGFKRIGVVMGVVSILLVSPMLLIAAIVALGCGWTIRPLTDRGLELRRYLAGLKQYIELAEKDRIKMLQSPEGAEKVGVKIKGGTDKKLIRLYERTLPYAVLFGQEKEWNKQLAVRYESTGSSPDWYVGHSAFNAAVFTSSMNDFSSSMNSYGTSSSSSTGGSSGGGSSGGGGGGGGGGGW